MTRDFHIVDVDVGCEACAAADAAQEEGAQFIVGALAGRTKEGLSLCTKHADDFQRGLEFISRPKP